MYWDGDEEDLVQYLELDEEGLFETKNLYLDEKLNHELAVDLIRELAH